MPESEPESQAPGTTFPEDKIRERYIQSRVNLLELLPHSKELRVCDNSEEADPHSGLSPEPKLIRHMENQRTIEMCRLAAAPEWAKAILMKAMKMGWVDAGTGRGVPTPEIRVLDA